MNIGAFLSPALTTLTDAAATGQAADVASQLRQRQEAIQALLLQRQLQQTQNETLWRQAEANAANARAGYYTARTPQMDAMRTALINAGNDPDDVDAVLASGNPGAIRDMLKPAAPAKSPSRAQALQSRILDLMGQGLPLEAANARARAELGYQIPSGGVGGTSRAVPETAEHRNLRQSASNTLNALRATQSQLAPLQRSLSTALTPADSAAVTPDIQRLTARRDSLQNAYDQQSAAMNRAGGVSAGAPAAKGSGLLDSLGLAGIRSSITRSAAPQGASLNQSPAGSDDVSSEIQRAQAQLNGILSNPAAPDSIKAQARAAYQRRVQLLTATSPAGSP